MLRVLMDDPMKYEEQINQKIKGQIFDSPGYEFNTVSDIKFTFTCPSSISIF